MKTRTLFTIGLLSCLFILAVSSHVLALHPPIPFQTVDRGEISHYRYGDTGFTGADLIITNPITWRWFWQQHTAGIQPPPSLPRINFGRETVVVTILGFQTTGGGPSIQVLEVNTDHGCNCLHVLIEDTETPGPLDVITNPFHIIKFKKSGKRSVVFEHQRP